MPARPSWTGAISFGLVNIPVGLYPATQDNEISFNLMHKEDQGRIKNQRVCSVCGKELAYDDLVRGYEYEKGSYVVVTDEDFKKVNIETTQAIAISDFVQESEIDPIYYERAYYVVPGKKSDTPYVLLREALRQSGMVGIAKVVLRNREHLAAIRVRGDALMLETMHFASEVRKAESIPPGDIEVGQRELDMAQMLIKAMSDKFDPEKYTDNYTTALTELIDQKVQGIEPAEAPQAREATAVVDLMEHLKRSIEAAEKSKEKAA